MKNSIMFLFIFLAVSISGCGQMMSSKGDVTEKAFSIKADNPQVKEFNKQLGEISDESTAAKAVNSFVGYVDSRLAKSGPSVQSLSSIIKPELVMAIAKKEAAARNAGISIMADDGLNAEPLDVGTITDNINALGSCEGVRVDDETVSTAKTVVERSVPNINPGESAGVTPLEAMVVGYALVSGDDGTASQESVNMPADKMGQFVENITQ